MLLSTRHYVLCIISLMHCLFNTPTALWGTYYYFIHFRDGETTGGEGTQVINGVCRRGVGFWFFRAGLFGWVGCVAVSVSAPPRCRHSSFRRVVDVMPYPFYRWGISSGDVTSVLSPAWSVLRSLKCTYELFQILKVIRCSGVKTLVCVMGHSSKRVGLTLGEAKRPFPLRMCIYI